MISVKSGCCFQSLERSSLIAAFYTTVRISLHKFRNQIRICSSLISNLYNSRALFSNFLLSDFLRWTHRRNDMASHTLCWWSGWEIFASSWKTVRDMLLKVWPTVWTVFHSDDQWSQITNYMFAFGLFSSSLFCNEVSSIITSLTLLLMSVLCVISSILLIIGVCVVSTHVC